MKVKVFGNGTIPTRGHKTDAGLDLYSPIDVTVKAGCRVTISLNICVALEEGTFGFIASRSSMFKRGIFTQGIVDSSYRGEVKVTLNNTSQYDYKVEKGDRISQMIIIPCSLEDVEAVFDMDETERGFGGFGSTGR